MQDLGELDRILERELGARADREMRGMRGIAEQDDVPVAPLAADDAREVDPRRAANIAGIGHQLMAAQLIGEELFEQAARFRSVEHRGGKAGVKTSRSRW